MTIRAVFSLAQLGYGDWCVYASPHQAPPDCRAVRIESARIFWGR
ncbi:hypothetical protein LCGC14_1692690 [marine sediment metagenome]|uniref:Uncharacterized protein n=1 Tax=marine sediment metagenome TaxID=412755 RepID=A0A0F9I7X3_9ZZZZ